MSVNYYDKNEMHGYLSNIHKYFRIYIPALSKETPWKINFWCSGHMLHSLKSGTRKKTASED